MHLTATELCALTGITYRQLDYWTGKGYLLAEDKHPGSGGLRLYGVPEADVALVLKAVSHLFGNGLNRKAKLKLCRRIRSGRRGKYEIVPGVILDLDVLTKRG